MIAWARSPQALALDSGQLESHAMREGLEFMRLLTQAHLDARGPRAARERCHRLGRGCTHELRGRARADPGHRLAAARDPPAPSCGPIYLLPDAQGQPAYILGFPLSTCAPGPAGVTSGRRRGRTRSCRDIRPRRRRRSAIRQHGHYCPPTRRSAVRQHGHYCPLTSGSGRCPGAGEPAIMIMAVRVNCAAIRPAMLRFGPTVIEYGGMSQSRLRMDESGTP